jgi:hypothetical protein
MYGRKNNCTNHGRGEKSALTHDLQNYFVKLNENYHFEY